MIGAREIARSYAEALYELGAEAGKVKQVERDLRRAAELTLESELHLVLRHPLVPRKDKLDLAEEIFAGLDPYVRNLLLLLVERGRIAYLGEIVAELRRLREEKEGLLHVQVDTPYPLDGLLERIRERLEELTGRKVLVEERLDRDLIGGIRIKMGDLVLDGSVRAQLERLRDALVS